MTTYAAATPPVRQTDSWSCSVASAAWMLHSLGITESYAALEAAMVQAGLVSPQDGLEVGSGGPLADWLGATFGVETGHVFPVTWDFLCAHAGAMPIMIGSGTLYHWVAVTDVSGAQLQLANPAPGYKGLGDTMTEAQFEYWAPWACIWVEVKEADDMTLVDDLVNTIGYLTGDVATAIQDALDSARAAPTKAARTAALDRLQAALDTLKRGGAAA